METPLYLNDLLHLDDEELAKTKIRFNQWNGEINPIDLYRKDPDQVNVRWLFWRSKVRYYNIGQNAVCFLRIKGDTWLLTTIKRITNELGVIGGINYEGYELEKYTPYYGRVIVKYHKSHQNQCLHLKSIIDKLEVLQILPTIYDGEDFPGYDKVRLSFSQLETIINRKKQDWVAALENQKAVYLITDLNNGKQYVGSATGENDMLLQRWASYVSNGHGGNVELKDIVSANGFDYVKRFFQYSILENYNARVDKVVILQRESWWKATLGSIRFGYNKS